MNNLNKFQALYDIISNDPSASFGNYNDYSVEINDNDLAATELKKLGITANKTRGQRIAISLNEIEGFLCYWNDEEFRTLCKSLDKFTNDIGILNINKEVRFFDAKSNISFLNFEQSQEDLLIKNVRKYWEFLNFLHDEYKGNEDKGFQFVDFYDEAQKNILFYSANTGRVAVPETIYDIDFIKEAGFEEKVDDFIGCFSKDNKHLSKFLKNEVLGTLTSVSSDERLNHLLSNLGQVVDRAKKNFQVYISELSIDNIKKGYEDYKHSFFDESSKIQNKLTNKVIGLPIVISTTLFAFSKVEDSKPGTFFLILSILATTFYLGVLLKISIEDLQDIKKSMNKSFSRLLQSKFFTKFPKEITDFTKAKDQIIERSELISNLIKGYFWVLFLSNLALIIYAVYDFFDLENNPIALIILIAGGLGLITGAYNYFLLKNIEIDVHIENKENITK